MGAIVAFLESLIQSVFMIIQFIFWLLGGLVNLGTMMTESINIYAEILQFFPSVITSALVAICGGLVVLRIFGRS